MTSWGSRLRLMLVTVVTCLLVAPYRPQTASAQEPVRNYCVNCHLGEIGTRSLVALAHTDEWLTSKHSLAGVDCEKCHGGDATAADPSVAHRSIKASADPSSPVYWMALPKTCGGCHPAEANAFAIGPHQQPLAEGNAMGPTCTSCHRSMAGDVLSPTAVEERCLQCHREDPRGRAHIARRQLEDLASLHGRMEQADAAIVAVIDSVHRRSLRSAFDEAAISIKRCGEGFHSFDQLRTGDCLAAARVQIDRVIAGAASP